MINLLYGPSIKIRYLSSLIYTSKLKNSGSFCPQVDFFFYLLGFVDFFLSTWVCSAV
jgi:hypothetical protein